MEAGVGGMEGGCGRHGRRMWEAWWAVVGGMEGGCGRQGGRMW